MKLFFKLFIIFIFSIFSLSVNAWFSDLFGWSSPKVNINCWGKDCNIQTWIEEVKWTVNWIETERWLAEYIQDIVLYILSFVSIIAVIYIIYSWFRILTWGWDEENLKKQKTNILHVILWMIIIWLAYPITIFIIWIFNN